MKFMNPQGHAAEKVGGLLCFCCAPLEGKRFTISDDVFPQVTSRREGGKGTKFESCASLCPKQRIIPALDRKCVSSKVIIWLCRIFNFCLAFYFEYEDRNGTCSVDVHDVHDD